MSPAAWVAYREKRLSGDDPDDEDEDVVRTVRRIMGPTYGSSKVKGDMNGAGRAEEEILSYPGVAFRVARSDGGAYPHVHLIERSQAEVLRVDRFSNQPHRRYSSICT